MRHFSCRRSHLAVLCTSVLFFAAAAQRAPQRYRTPLSRQPAASASRFGGKVTFAVVDLKTGEHFGLAAKRPVPTASVINLPVMAETFYQIWEGKR